MSYPATSSPLPDLSSFSQQEMLALFDRILPNHYLAPLKDPGPGYEYLQAVAQMTARVSQAIAHVGTGQYIRSATGGSYSTGTVEFYRTSTLGSAITVEAGTIVGTADGYLYATTAPVNFISGSDVGPYQVGVQALVRGWLYDQPGPFVSAHGDVVAGPVSLIVTPLVAAPVYFDFSLQVRQVSAITGGAAPMLDGLGWDRGMPRTQNETDAAYRNRMMTLPDTVTPAAMQRIITESVGAQIRNAGQTYIYREIWDLRLMTAWDFPTNMTLTKAALNVAVPPFSGNIFIWDFDQPDVPDQLANRWYGDVSTRGAFYVGLPNIPSLFPDYAGMAQNLESSRPAGITVNYILD